MTPIEKLKKQHMGILAILDQISANLHAANENECASSLLQLIKQLSSLLEEHLLIEDDFLYPALKKRPQSDIRDIAYEFSIELGGIKNVFLDYTNKWTSSKNIVQSNMDFISESKALVGALRRRIVREDRELFPIVEE